MQVEVEVDFHRRRRGRCREVEVEVDFHLRRRGRCREVYMGKPSSPVEYLDQRKLKR